MTLPATESPKDFSAFVDDFTADKQYGTQEVYIGVVDLDFGGFESLADGRLVVIQTPLEGASPTTSFSLESYPMSSPQSLLRTLGKNVVAFRGLNIKLSITFDETVAGRLPTLGSITKFERSSK